MPDFGRWTSHGGDPSLNEINRVDRFFDALATNDTAYSTDHAEAELAFLLADWRDDVREAPPVVQLTTRDAVAALNSGLSHRHGRPWLALVASAAAAVLCVGGFGAAVYGSGPGDALYGMRTTLFGAQSARDDQVVLSAQTEMMQVRQLIDQGQWQQAQDKLVALSTTVQSVDTPEQKQQLTQQFNELTYKVVEQDPAAKLPPPDQPQPVLSNSPLTLLPVPAVVDSSTPSSSSTTSSTLTTPTSPTSESPGPEIVLTTPPSSDVPGSVGAPSSPATPPSSPASVPSSPASPPSSAPPSSSSPASSPSSAPASPPSSPASPPSSASAPSSPPSPPSSAAVPPSSPASVPGSPASPPSSAPAAPPSGASSNPGPALAPPAEVTSVTPVAPAVSVPAPASQPRLALSPEPAAPQAPKRSNGDEQIVTTTPVAPPR